ncbi:hypothetical protein Tco_0996969 [Tanacetum coccineum]
MEKLHNNKQKWVKGQEIPLNLNPHPQLLHYLILNQLILIPLVANETVIKEWEDRIERATTNASSLEAEQDNGNINRTQSMVTLNESFPQGTGLGSGPRVNTLGSGEDNMKLKELMDLCTKLPEKFWQTATVSTLDNGEMEITAIIDGKVKIVTEASIRRHLKLEDFDGISNLPTTEIFEQLALMGNMRRASMGYTRVDIPLFPTMLVQGERSTVPVESHHTPTSASSTSQPPSSSPSRRTTKQESMVPQPRSPTQTNVVDKAASTGVDFRHGGLPLQSLA